MTDAAQTPPTMPEVIQGWADIAAALKVDPTTARKYADRDVDPLPIWYDHADRPTIFTDALRQWVNRQAYFRRTYKDLKAAGRLPGQIRTQSKPAQHRRRLKVSRESAG